MTRDELKLLVEQSDGKTTDAARTINWFARQLLAGPTLEQMERWRAVLAHTSNGHWEAIDQVFEMDAVIQRMKEGRSDE